MENNIEEAIKIMEHWIEYEKNNKEKINRADELINIQETILSAYKRVLKEKNRLEEQVEYDKTHIYTPQTIKLNFISKSKIKDKIEQLKEKEESDLRCYGFAVDTHLALQTLQELLDGNDTNVGSIGNSIEEEIETLEELRTHGYAMLLMKYEDRIKTNRKIDQALEHIVSDYKKVLKENEILKEEKEQAWEEWNNLEQGSYGTEQKLKQQIKELRKENEELNNRCRNLDKEAQAYLEELAGDNTLTRRTIKQLQEENEELKNKLSLKQFDVNIVYNDYLEKLDEYERNNIPKQKVKDKIEELEKDEYSKYYYMFLEERDLKYTIQILQELLEGRE